MKESTNCTFMLHEFGLRPADLELMVTLISELVDAEFACLWVFQVLDTEGRPPNWQHNNKLDSWDKTALPYLTVSLSLCCMFVLLYHS